MNNHEKKNQVKRNPGLLESVHSHCFKQTFKLGISDKVFDFVSKFTFMNYLLFWYLYSSFLFVVLI